MRQVITLKFLAVALTIALAGVFLLWFYSAGGSAPIEKGVGRRIDKGALILEVGADADWSISGGRTRGNIVLTLNDDTVANITPQTIGVNYCKALEPNKCVLLADMLGPAVIWFAIVDANKTGAGSALTLGGLVDMEDGGDTGVLANGWLIPLATPTARQCDVTTSNLRDFINRYADDKSTSNFDLKTDQITSVSCSE